MEIAFFTLFEGNYGLGVAALANSLVASGFRGKFIVCHRQLEEHSEKPFTDQHSAVLVPFGIELVTMAIECDRHLGYHKPFAARSILEVYPGIDAVCYADPDILVLCSWHFMEKWISSGVALCADSNFPIVAKHHPWRRDWLRLLGDAELVPLEGFPDVYHNSGFFAVSRRWCGLLDHWCAITNAFERTGGDTSRFLQHERERGVTGDQDLLASALMAFEGDVSTLGPEGMGFNGHYFILSHATQSPKPWNAKFACRALRGTPPSMTEDLFLRHSRFPIEVFTRKIFYIKSISLKVAKLISRFWARP